MDKVRDIAGLYLNPPDKALVLCVDEKSPIQALERAASAADGLGLRRRYHPRLHPARHDHPVARLDISTGEVFTRCKQRHRHQEFLRFREHIDASVSAGLDVHLVLDNYATHKHPAIRATADAILAKLERLLRAISGTER